jgi:putative transcriptional regulator
MNRIKEILQERGIKQRWLAEKIGKSYAQVNNYYHHRSEPSLSTLYKISEVLQVDVKLLLAEQDKDYKYVVPTNLTSN